MKKLLYLSMLAITILASCNSKENEDKAFARVSTSNNPQEMRAYLDNYFEEASPEHLVKIRKNLRVWVDDSTAYANICKTKDLATKISLENEYMEKFKDGGNIGHAALFEWCRDLHCQGIDICAGFVHHAAQNLHFSLELGVWSDQGIKHQTAVSVLQDVMNRNRVEQKPITAIVPSNLIQHFVDRNAVCWHA